MTVIAIIATIIADISVILGVVKWVTKKYNNVAKKSEDVAEGVKCLLRNEMLQTYYRHRDSENVRQFEYENFVMLHGAYKALGGNSFIDKIYEDVKEWEVTT